MFDRSFARRMSTRVVLATIALSCARFVDLTEERGFVSSRAYAQTIINDSRASDNRFVGFSSGASKAAPVEVALLDSSSPSDVVGSFENARNVDVDLVAPKSGAKNVGSSERRIPFAFPKGSDSEAASSIELLCSDDQGATWRSYASVRANEGRRAFLFQAPRAGEYWFALQTNFKSGKTALSSTRAYRFEAPTLNSVGLNDDFALAEDYEDSLDAPSLLPVNGEPLMIDNSSYVDETEVADESSFASSAKDAQGTTIDAAQGVSAPRPGKLKRLSFGKEENTERLMVLVRWFQPEELEARYRGEAKTLKVERAANPNGPWTTVGEDLAIEQPGYAWIATEEEMKPFYVRTVVVENGEELIDVTSSPLDVTAPGVRAALGSVKTPAPFPPSDDDSTGVKSETTQDASGKLADSPASELEKSREDARAVALKTTTRGAAQDENLASVAAPVRERPRIPAPTNPNELSFNPLFTIGPSVLVRAAQTRFESGSSKRSVFTPPARTPRVGSIPPAEYRRSAAQIAAQRAAEERRAQLAKMEEEAKYQKEHEMDVFSQKPELMEGRVFYMDKDGKMTTTPPPEFQQALGYTGSLDGIDWAHTTFESPQGTVVDEQGRLLPGQIVAPQETGANGTLIQGNATGAPYGEGAVQASPNGAPEGSYPTTNGTTTNATLPTQLPPRPTTVSK